MTTRTPKADQQTDVETVQAVADAIPGAPTDTPAHAIPSNTGDPIDNDTADDAPVAHLKALGNAKADITVTAVRNAQGHWTWTARDTYGAELARSPHPHNEITLIDNLGLLFSGQGTVALHRTGDDKPRRLN